MKLYKKVREIPGCDDIEVLSKEEWIKFFDGMNLQFDYMVDSGYIKPNQIELEDIILDFDRRLNAIENYLTKNVQRD